MKSSFLKTILLLSILTSISACGSTHYGNKKISKKSNIEQIAKGDSVEKLKSLIGEPTREHKIAKSSNRIYEYEYHKGSRSIIYYIPVASTLYYAFGRNPFSLKLTTSGKIVHNYLFVEVDKDNKIQNKSFYKQKVPIKFHQGCQQGHFQHECQKIVSTQFPY